VANQPLSGAEALTFHSNPAPDAALVQNNDIKLDLNGHNSALANFPTHM
jgi:hypothetical protein